MKEGLPQKIFSAKDMEAFMEEQRRILSSRPLNEKSPKMLFMRLKGNFARTFNSHVANVYSDRLKKLAEEVWTDANKGKTTNTQLYKSQDTNQINLNIVDEKLSANYWNTIERGFISLKKDFAILRGYCIARLGLPSSNFINYMIPHIGAMEETITGMFSEVDKISFSEDKFISSLKEFMGINAKIKEEIEYRKKYTPEISMDVFDKEVERFTRNILTYINFIITRAQEVIRIKKIKPPSI